MSDGNRTTHNDQPPRNTGGTMQDDLERLRVAWLDFAFAVMSAVGFVWLARRLGLKLKPWAAEREHRHDD